MYEAQYSNFIYVRDAGYIFSYIPKVACTNWKCLLRKKLGYTDWLDSQIAHNRDLSGLSYVGNYSDPESLISDPEIKKYAMVRNPYSRVLSAYLNKIQSRNSLSSRADSNDWYARVHRKIVDWGSTSMSTDVDKVSFSLFLQWLANSGDVACGDEHWVPQSQLLKLNHVNFDFIGRFEQLSSDAPKLMSKMGIEGDFPTQSDVRFPATSASNRTYEYFGQSELDLVSSLYSEDFELLGYER